MFMLVGNKERRFCLFIVVCVSEKGQCVLEGVPAVTHPGLKQK